METKVSVVIPVYNASEHLNQCMDTVVGQTLQEIEIICVDDGSTDSSLEILNEYAKNDGRIKVLTQRNQFAGVARNSGMAIATGKYIIFWDSDDYFRADALEKMYNKCEEDNADVCVCEGRHFYQNKKIETASDSYMTNVYLPDTIPFNRKTNEKYVLNFTKAHPWNKMFRLDFVKEQGLFFQDTRNANDLFFTISALCLAERITLVREALVVYRMNQDTSLSKVVKTSPRIALDNWVAVREFLIEKNAFPEQSFANTVLLRIPFILRNISDLKTFKETVNWLKKEGLEKLSLREHEEGYYYVAWRAELLHRIIVDTPEEILFYLMTVSFDEANQKNMNLNIERAKNKAAKDKLIQEHKKEVKAIKESWSYRIGNKIVYLPGKIKRIGK